MNAVRMLIPLALVAAACSETKQVPVETTSATMKAEANRLEMAQLMRERNDARAALAEERNARDLERQKTMSESSARREHDELELRVLSVMEKADSDVRSLYQKNAKASAKQKKENDRAIQDAQQYKAKLHADLQRLHGDVGKPWDEFRADVETDIKGLEQALSSVSASETNKAPAETNKAPAEQKAKPRPQTPANPPPSPTSTEPLQPPRSPQTEPLTP